jgi:hypothetical protein
VSHSTLVLRPGAPCPSCACRAHVGDPGRAPDRAAAGNFGRGRDPRLALDRASRRHRCGDAGVTIAAIGGAARAAAIDVWTLYAAAIASGLALPSCSRACRRWSANGCRTALRLELFQRHEHGRDVLRERRAAAAGGRIGKNDPPRLPRLSRKPCAAFAPSIRAKSSS